MNKNTDKLLEALELPLASAAESIDDETLLDVCLAQLKEALHLARQLVKDYKTNEQNCAMSHVDEFIYDALRKKNERLESRLSLAEQESKWYREDRDNFQMKFSAAETRLAGNMREDGVERWRGEAELYMRLYGEQREKNERLEGDLRYAHAYADKEWQENQLNIAIDALRARLSAAEEALVLKQNEKDILYAVLQETTTAFQRAEEVVQAAKRYDEIDRAMGEWPPRTKVLPGEYEEARLDFRNTIHRFEEKR